MISIRLATMDDVRAFSAVGLPPWCVEWVGWVGERDGRIVALGSIAWDKWGRTWGMYDSRERLSPFTMHRLARRVISHLREIEVSVLHAYCNDRVPDAAKWLRRLGFRPSLSLPPDPSEVWVCDLK